MGKAAGFVAIPRSDLTALDDFDFAIPKELKAAVHASVVPAVIAAMEEERIVLGGELLKTPEPAIRRLDGVLAMKNTERKRGAFGQDSAFQHLVLATELLGHDRIAEPVI